MSCGVWVTGSTRERVTRWESTLALGLCCYIGDMTDSICMAAVPNGYDKQVSSASP